tara:strand:- start:2443 stop:2937 length:495 start_codon:yes stop_codon:yes gene_type:complete
MAELYDKDVRTINEHLVNIYNEEELVQNATIRKFRIVRLEGVRQVNRQIDHYNLEAILAVGYRVRSQRGTQFRQWATQVLQEYLIKGFAMDDERLKNPPVGHSAVPDYFDEMLERIRDIERVSVVSICELKRSLPWRQTTSLPIKRPLFSSKSFRINCIMPVRI